MKPGCYPREPAEKRFSKRTEADRGPGTCLEWIGQRDEDGYGIFWFQGKSRKAHRVAWFMAYGTWPPVVRHFECDNPPCIRLAHLAGGTSLDNDMDRVRKGRSATGAMNGSRMHPDRLKRGEAVAIAKLTPELVRWARGEAAAGRSYGSLARKLQVTPRTVMLAVTRETWRHVEDAPHEY